MPMTTFNRLSPKDGAIQDTIALNIAAIKSIVPGPHGRITGMGFMVTSSIICYAVGKEEHYVTVDGVVDSIIEQIAVIERSGVSG